ncbi:MAG: hypothetical protein EOM55_03305 [Clostridia bacterium]|nr:hypothetical protein [Clostridia bacterium]
MEKNILQQFAERKDKGKVQEFYDQALDIITRALTDLNLKNERGVNALEESSTRIFPIGDYTNDTFIDQTGELEIVIASSNPQLIVANKIFSKNFSEAKTKKQKQNILNEGTFDKVIVNLTNCLLPYFDEKTTLMIVNDGIKILSLEEYGFKILIRFATYNIEDEDAILNFWEVFLKKSTPVNLFLYNENIEKKDKETKGNYKRLVRIFKNIRKNILINRWTTSSSLNKYFIELVCYNIPNSLLLDNDLHLLFCKAVNYLDNCNVLDFTSFDGQKIQSFYFAKISFENILNFTKYLIKISYS